MDVDSEGPQSESSNIALNVNGTSHTGHSSRFRRMNIGEIPVTISGEDAEDATTASYTTQASTPHAMDTDEDMDMLSPTLLYRDTAQPAGSLVDEDIDDTSHMVITGISDTRDETSIPDEGAGDEEDNMEWLSRES